MDCVEYLVNECHADTTKRDKNGQTPLDLAIKKSQHLTEWVLRQLTSKNWFYLVSSLDRKAFSDPKTLQYLFFGAREKELARWAWRIVFWSNLIGTITTINFAISMELADLYFLHKSNTMLQFIWWIMFAMCLFKMPGYVRDCSDNEKYSYASGLDVIGSIGQGREAWDPALSDSLANLPSLCHTCRVRRPLRSKHCKIANRCVHKFDHFW